MDIDISKSPYILGIDLGTTNSSAAIYHRGESVSIPLDDAKGLSIPSCVWFPEKSTENVRVGKEAKQKILIKPDEVFSSFKPLMKGEDWKKEEGNQSLLKKFESVAGIDLTPTDVATKVLEAILLAVQNQSEFEVDGEIQKVVITVPANTTEQYHKNVYKSALAAGLGLKDDEGEVIMEEDRPVGVRILEEPTAAALAYGLDMGFVEEGASKEQTILVYDLGGGTFDATVLHIDASQPGSIPQFNVKATRGVAQLGGDDFDMMVMEMAAEVFQAESEIDIFDLKSDQKATSTKVLKEAQQRLKEEAEKAKIELANGAKSSEIVIPNFLKDGDGGNYDLEYELKSTEYLPRIEPLLEKANQCVNDVLSDAGMGIDGINRVIVVGGSTKANWVVESVERLGKKPYVAKNVDVIVSKGAAFFGASVPTSGEVKEGEEEGGVSVNKTTNHHLGIEIQGAEYSLLIEKDLPIEEGISRQKTFYNPDHQDVVNITIYKTQHIQVEGEKGDKQPAKTYYINEKEGDSKLFDCIGDFRLSGIPKAARGTEPIDVIFEVDKDNHLSVSATIRSTGEAANVDITL